jgi:hypothetical protein
MKDVTMTQSRNDQPICTWIPVTDAQGRTRMEARWISPAAAVSPFAA